ncbi:hypothetical protein [Clostridium sp. Cult2]|uniref:hypothetical protein n=1 Tax=Clostridium sp. Cult2 TaxID=2079003 RepID=UPI001F234853|nr:hypothetical protein [Clostridium sp. Cult2]
MVIENINFTPKAFELIKYADDIAKRISELYEEHGQIFVNVDYSIPARYDCQPKW